MKKKILIIFGLAFLIRLINLNQSFWLDEAIVAKVVRTIPFHLIPVKFSPGDFHPPFYYMFMSIWGNIFGYSEIALRMPSIIMSLITGWMVYKIGLLITDKKIAFWAMLFFLFNPLIIYYSQEARMYMMSTFFLTTTLFYFIDLIQNKDGKQVLKIKSQKSNVKSKSQKLKVYLFILFIGLSITTFYGSIFFIVALTACALIRGKVKIALLIIVTVILSVLLLSPLLLQQLQTAKFGLIEVKNWSLVLGKANIKNFLLIFIKFTSGRLSWSPKWIYYLVIGCWLLVVGFFVILGMRKNKLLSTLFALPLLFVFIVSFFLPMLQYFRYLYLIPVMSLLLAKGVEIFGNNIDLDSLHGEQVQGKPGLRGNDILKFILSILKSNFTSIILFFYIIFSFVYLFNPSFHREDWKSLSHSLDLSKPVYMIIPSSDPINYYRKNIVLKEIRLVSQIKQMEKNIYVIPYVVEIYGLDYKKELINKGCILLKQTSFRELLLEEWSCGYVAMVE